MRTSIFEYKGFVGIKSDPTAEGFIAHPGNGNLGCVIDASHVDISPEAIVLLKKIKKGSGSFAEFDVFNGDDKTIVMSWLGGYLNAFKPEDISSSRDYDPSLLKASETLVKVPEEFKQFIDNIQ